MQLKDWLRLVGVVVGTLLAGSSVDSGNGSLRVAKTRKAIARALADLLEVRLRLLIVPKTAELLSQRAPMLPEGQTTIGTAFARPFSPDAG
jgi:hypothetical protein